MARTIVIFTNGDSLVRVKGSLDADNINAQINADTPLHDVNEDRLYLLLDSTMLGRDASTERERFAKVPMTGTLHFVHHTTPNNDERTAFIKSLRTASPDLQIGPGFEGEHNPKENYKKAHPYQQVAACLKKKEVCKEDFDDLWNWLEKKDPIIDLYADKLDYIYAILEGRTDCIPSDELSKAIAADREKSKAIEVQLQRIDGKSYSAELYDPITKFSDLVMSVELNKEE